VNESFADRRWPISGRGLELLALLLLSAWVVFQTALLDWKLDDAFISFAYARNWAAGAGVVFNPGERVEGYTSFLWVLLMAQVLRAGGDPLSASTIVGGACAVGCVSVAWGLARSMLEPTLRPLALLSALIVAAHPSLALWAASGMETLLFSLLLSLALWRHVAHGASSIAAPVCLALAFDGMIYLRRDRYWVAPQRRPSYSLR
jgi:arabinofuranosyltransferase